MTLKQWAEKQEYRVEYIDSGGARWSYNIDNAVQATIPDAEILVDRAEAWRLEDFRVNCVTGGKIWFSKK